MHSIGSGATMARRSRQKVRASRRYGARQMAEAYVSLYREVAARPEPKRSVA